MKIVVLVISVLGSSLILLRGNAVDLQLCEAIDTGCRLFYSNVWKVSLFFPLILLFSSITYWLPKQAFDNWFKFLVIWGPLTLLVSTLIYTNTILNSIDMYGGILEFYILTGMYSIFFLISSITIFRGYKTSRKAKPNR